MSWFAVDRLDLAEVLGLDPSTNDHGAAAGALEGWVHAQRGAGKSTGGGLVAVMRREGRYRALPEAEVRAEESVWLEAQWETLLFERAGGKAAYSGPWMPAAWEQVAKDLARAIGLPFLRDATRRGLFGFRAKHGLLGFLTLREVRETLKSWGQIDPTRFRGTTLRLQLVEEIQGSLRAVSELDREMIMSLV